MALSLCEHIKTGGARCGSPAMRDQKFCHHHAGVHRLVPRTHVFLTDTPVMQIDPCYPYHLPYLEDFESLHIGYMQFIRGVVDQRIDPRRAKLVLEALKAAGTDLRHKDKLLLKATELSARRKPPATATQASPGVKRNA